MALRSIADGKLPNVSGRTLDELRVAGLIDAKDALTEAGRKKATYAAACQARRRERTMHTGGLALPARWLKAPE